MEVAADPVGQLLDAVEERTHRGVHLVRCGDDPVGQGYPGVQLRFTDVDGLRLTAFVTNTRKGQPTGCSSSPGNQSETSNAGS